MAAEVREKFEQLSNPISTVTDVADQVDDATGSGADVQQVTVQQPGILSQVAGSALSIVTTTIIVFILTLFLLASGDHFSEQIVKSFGSLTDKKRALRTVRDIEGGGLLVVPMEHSQRIDGGADPRLPQGPLRQCIGASWTRPVPFGRSGR